MTNRLLYVELKTGYAHNGPAWIGRGEFTRTGRTLYFNGLALQRAQGVVGNFVDAATGFEYWVSGLKKGGTDRHRAGRGKILIDREAVAEYLAFRGLDGLPRQQFEIGQLTETSAQPRFHQAQNHFASQPTTESA